MEQKRKNKLLSETSYRALGALGGVEVALRPVSNQQKSALQIYAEKKKINLDLNQPISAEVIDFIVDSLNLLPKDDFFSSYLKKGFQSLNQSKTARQLMALIPPHLSVRLFEAHEDIAKGEENNFFTVGELQTIFVPLNVQNKFRPDRGAIEFLHEVGHILDQRGIRPFSPDHQIFKNKEDKEISAFPSDDFSGREAYQVDLILEAEKQAISYQIAWERASLLEKAGMGLSTMLMGVSETVLSPFGTSSLKAQNSTLILRQGLRYNLNRFKKFLKHPFSFLNKDKRAKINEDAKKEAMFQFMTSLVKEEKKMKGENAYKALSLSLLTLGVLGVGLSPVLAPILLGCGVLSGAGYLKEASFKFKKEWQEAYLLNGLNNLKSSNWRETSDKKAFHEVLEALRQKYNQSENIESLKRTLIDEQGYQNLIESKKCYQALPLKMREDLVLVMDLFFNPGGQNGEKKQTTEPQVVQFMSLFLEYEVDQQKQKEPLEERFLTFMTDLFKENLSDITPALKEVSLSDLNKIHNKKLRLFLLKTKEGLSIDTSSKKRQLAGLKDIER